MENSKIEWTDHTFNPWQGCMKVSPACANCYAESHVHRFHPTFKTWGPNSTRIIATEKQWNNPLKWNKSCQRKGIKQKVFCASLADVFESNNQVTEARQRLFELIQLTPNLIWLLLTKRPQNILSLIPDHWLKGGLPTNVWFGTTAEDQQYADERIPELLHATQSMGEYRHKPVAFLSCEPLLGPINLGQSVRKYTFATSSNLAAASSGLYGNYINWVIAGGESGPNARMSKLKWFRSLRDECKEAGVPFLFKQWGCIAPIGQFDSVNCGMVGVLTDDDVDNNLSGFNRFSERTYFRLSNKQRTGRLLDGVEHNECPAL